MSPEELQSAIDFMVEAQAKFWAQQQIFEENHKKLQARQENTHAELEILLQVSRGLVEVARRHEDRLDRLENPGS